MAKSDSTTIVQCGYQFNGKVTPLSTLTKNPAFFRLASKLYKQALNMVDAEQKLKSFHYKPVQIPKNLRHIFQ